MSPNRDWFNTYQPIDGGNVLMGNNVACKVVRIYTIQIKMHDGVIRTWTDVRHVLELKKNLIFLGTLDFNGCTYKTGSGVLMISKGALVVMKWKKINGLYTLQGSTVTGAVGVAVSTSESIIETTRLWHMQLGHMSERGLTILSKRGFLDGQKIGKLDFCEHCVFGKQCKVKFNTGVHRTKGTLNYIHSNL